MKRTFRLASVLRFRKHQLELATLALASALDVEREAGRAATEARMRTDLARSRMRQELRDGLSAARLRSVAEGLTHWEDQVEELAQRATEAAAEVETCRAALMEARQRVRALERLEANHASKLATHLARVEQNALDEVGVRRVRNGIAGVLLCLVLGLPMISAPARAEGAEPAAQSGDHAVTSLLAEIRALQSDLDRRERALEDRERNVAALEAAAAKQLGELERIAATVEKRIAAWEEDNGDSVRRLSKIYSSMQPGRAAELLEELDVSLATQIVAKMKHKQSAAVMTQLSESRALAMSRRVAHPLGMKPARPPAAKEK